MSTMQNLSVKDLIDAFSGAKEAARDALPNREQVLRALGGRPADDGMMASLGIFAAGIVLGAGLAVLFAPRPGSEIDETISSLRPVADA